MDKAQEYHVVINSEEQYSIWPTAIPQPAGWRTIGFQASKEQCLEHIKKVWVDMRPLSLRRAMDSSEATSQS